MISSCAACAGLFVILLISQDLAAAEVIDVQTRDSHIRILIEGPADPSHAVALLAGGNGDTEIKGDGSIGRRSGSFAVRTHGFLHGQGRRHLARRSAKSASSP